MYWRVVRTGFGLRTNLWSNSNSLLIYIYNLGLFSVLVFSFIKDEKCCDNQQRSGVPQDALK